MPVVIGELLAFLGQHADLVEAIYKAITSGASKESLHAAIKKAQETASDEVMREELGLAAK